MRIVRAGLTATALVLPLALAVPPAQAQQNQFADNVQHFFEGMTPSGSMRQAYEAGRRDEYAALRNRGALGCAPQSYGYNYNTQPYGYPSPSGPYASR